MGTAVALAALAVALAVGQPGPVESPSWCRWQPPVTAAVVDPFRPPDHPFGPGNRGLEYDTEQGSPVVAVAYGRVEFVGPVGGNLYVVVGHAGGLRSTSGPLASTGVVRGQDVTAGQAVGRAEPGLHLTARLGERYVDPVPLLEHRCGRARLVGVDRPRQ